MCRICAAGVVTCIENESFSVEVKRNNCTCGPRSSVTGDRRLRVGKSFWYIILVDSALCPRWDGSNKLGSFVIEFLSAASDAHCGALWRMLMSVLVVSRFIRFPPTCTVPIVKRSYGHDQLPTIRPVTRGSERADDPPSVGKRSAFAGERKYSSIQ